MRRRLGGRKLVKTKRKRQKGCKSQCYEFKTLSKDSTRRQKRYFKGLRNTEMTRRAASKRVQTNSKLPQNNETKKTKDESSNYIFAKGHSKRR